MSIKRFGWLVLGLSLAALGCSDSDDKGDSPSTMTDELEIVGEYTDQFMTEQVITADEWNGAAIQEYDNDQNVVYTQLPEDDMFNPSKFNKIMYTQPEDDSFAFCIVVFDAETLADAKASDATADENDLEEGCAGFEWSIATKN